MPGGNLTATSNFLRLGMHLESMILTHGLLTKLGEERIDQLLDLMEDPIRRVSAETLEELRWFLKELEAELGEDHPAVAQVRKALLLPPKHNRAKEARSSTGNRGLRIS